jgi:hypothetical protein
VKILLEWCKLKHFICMFLIFWKAFRYDVIWKCWLNLWMNSKRSSGKSIANSHFEICNRVERSWIKTLCVSKIFPAIFIKRCLNEPFERLKISFRVKFPSLCSCQVHFPNFKVEHLDSKCVTLKLDPSRKLARKGTHDKNFLRLSSENTFFFLWSQKTFQFNLLKIFQIYSLNRR